MNEEVGGLSQDDEPYVVSLNRAIEAKRIAGERRHAPSSEHVCATCGDAFTVTPPARPGSDWDDCLAWGCPSYTPSRDVTLMLDEVQREGGAAWTHTSQR